MKASYPFIHFIQHGEHNGQPMWECRNNKDSGIKLGIVFWYPTWGKYCFTQDGPNVVFSADCLVDTADFLGQLVKPCLNNSAAINQKDTLKDHFVNVNKMVEKDTP